MLIIGCILIIILLWILCRYIEKRTALYCSYLMDATSRTTGAEVIRKHYGLSRPRKTWSWFGIVATTKN